MKRIKKVLAVGAFLALAIPFFGAGLKGLYLSSKYINPPWDKILLGLIILCVVGIGRQAVRAYRRTAKDFKENKKATDQGFADAQSSLGYMYQQGLGVEKDGKEALKWYRKAADQGNAHAQSSLGYVYQQGLGVERDDVTAYAWYTLAAANGNEYAKKSMSIADQMEDATLVAREGRMTETAARRVAADIYQIVNKDKLPASNIRSYFERWLERKAIENVESTHTRYSITINQVLDYLGDLADKDISYFDSKVIAEIRDRMAKEKSPRSLCIPSVQCSLRRNTLRAKNRKSPMRSGRLWSRKPTLER